MKRMKKPLALIILDGFGINNSDYGNAIHSAKKPYINNMLASNPVTQIGASGMDVGLPDGQMGNSEVGHTNIGAGRIVYQELTRITKSIADGDFFENEALIAACNNSKKNGSALHLIGLVSDGGVHSHNTHLYALLELAKRQGVADVYVHCLTDGRDVPPNSGAQFINELEAEMARIGAGKIATIIGRYYGMDRDNRWERVEKAYAAIAYGEGVINHNAVDAVNRSYSDGITDEFIAPVVVTEGAQLKSEDSVIFFNFRPDRAREIARTIVDPDFTGFARKTGFLKPYFVCMTQYDKTMPNVTTAFSPQSLANTFGEYLSQNGISQLRIAETEKYPHVTFFFNGGVETVYEGENRVLIPSPKVATYDMQPEMSAYLVTDAVVERIEKGLDDVIILNYANCDMVGHTGVFDAAVQAVEAVNACLARTVDAILAKGGIALITADHGNADQMYEPDGSPFTAHTTNPVPFAVVGLDCKLRSGGRLCDIAPTMLDILGLAKPAEMTGESLIEK